MEKIIQNEKVYLPEYEGGSIVNVPSSILAKFGVEPPYPKLNDEIYSCDDSGDCSRAVLFIFDSLGYNCLQDCDCLNDFNVVPLTSVFPSTTVAAVTSLYTAVPPSVHGMIGFRLFLKEYGLLSNMIKLSPAGFEERDKLQETGFVPDEFLPVKTIFEMLGEHDIKSYAFTRMHYYKSGLSSIMLKGAEVKPYVNIVDMFLNVKKIIKEVKGKTFITAYVDDFDTTAHYYGTRTEEERTTIDVFMDILKNVFLREKPKDTEVILTADHGQMHSLPGTKIDITKHRWLMNHITMPPSGEFRASYLFVKDGCKDRCIEELNSKFSDKFIILSREEAIEQNLFGRLEISERNRERVGDIILISKGENFLFYPYSEFELKARHGGLNSREMLVPFAVLQ
jgi:predicted AlkP superfamily pyrophosphatase or phosphodiesterase